MPGLIYVHSDSTVTARQLELVLDKHGVKAGSPDLLMIEAGTKINVEISKQIQEFLGLKPYSLPLRAVVIQDATNLSEIVQNSLLKTLEELRPDRLVILAAGHTQSLLPTLLSRVEVHQLASEQNQMLDAKTIEKLEQVLNADTEERFKWVEKLKDRGEVVDQLLRYYQPKVLQQPQLAKAAELILTAEQWLNANVNPRAVLEYLMLRLPKLS